jgi:4-amino-4-deoxy-L-arabinose transferase-like glycosyltransferase
MVFFTVFLCVSSVVFSPYTISVDGFSYLKSSEVLFTPDFAAFYTWVREPGYPLFVRLLEESGGLFLVFLSQALVVAFGILATIHATYRLLRIEAINWKTFASSGLAIVLVAGYSSTLLQQAILIGLFGLLLLVISRVVIQREFNLVTGVLIFVLLLLATLTAVFIGLAFGLALFATLVFSGVWKLKLLVSYSALSILAFSLVMVPWSQIKSSQAPEEASDAVEMAAFNTEATLTNFNLEKEFYEAIFTQASLLNLGGEFPPISGLGIANENRIFGAPVYSTDHACGRFLTGVDPDTLWGKIETRYRDRCVPLQTLNLISFVNRFAQLFYPFVGLALLTALTISIRPKSILGPLVFPAFLVTLPYLVMDASISRYGALLIPLGAVLLMELTSSRLMAQAAPRISTENMWQRK